MEILQREYASERQSLSYRLLQAVRSTDVSTAINLQALMQGGEPTMRFTLEQPPNVFLLPPQEDNTLIVNQDESQPNWPDPMSFMQATTAVQMPKP